MIRKDDFRLSGHQANYLHGELLRFGRYRPPRPGSEHDHCEFCWARFSSSPRQGCVTEGFFTDERRWICEGCYEDFKVMFDWQLEG
jgi:hypothetical protein